MSETQSKIEHVEPDAGSGDEMDEIEKAVDGTWRVKLPSGLETVVEVSGDKYTLGNSVMNLARFHSTFPGTQFIATIPTPEQMKAIDEAIEVLKSIEWTNFNCREWEGTPTFEACPSCQNERKNGHHKGCKLAAALTPSATEATK